MAREIEDVALRGAAERVDALRIVSHDRDVPMRSAHASQDATLQLIRILVFIHQHMVVHAGDATSQIGRMLQQQRPAQEQVVVVHERALLLAADVLREHADDLLGVVEELRHVPVQHVLERDLGVDVARVHPVERLLLRKALVLLSDAKAGARDPHEIDGVALVHDRELRRHRRAPAELAQQAVARGVERSAVHARARGAHETFGTRQHFLGGAAREGEQQDSVG